MSTFLTFKIVFILLQIILCLSLPEYFCNVGGLNDCTVGVTPGTTIKTHGQISTTTSTLGTLTITRGGTALTSGAAYVAGETLLFSVTAPSSNYVLITATGATFTGGYCTGKNRLYADTNSLTGTIIMPASGVVQVWILWSSSSSAAITPSPYFILNSAATSKPTFVPTLKPTIVPMLQPTALPTMLPSLLPTKFPTLALSPCVWPDISSFV